MKRLHFTEMTNTSYEKIMEFVNQNIDKGFNIDTKDMDWLDFYSIMRVLCDFGVPITKIHLTEELSEDQVRDLRSELPCEYTFPVINATYTVLREPNGNVVTMGN